MKKPVELKGEARLCERRSHDSVLLSTTMSSGRPRSVEYERKEQHGTAKTPVKVVLVTETYYLRLYEFPIGTKFASFCTDSILFPEKTKN